MKGVVFDFDGIIVDSEPLHYRAFQKVLDPIGVGYSWQDYVDRYMGFDDRDAFREAFRVRGHTLDDGKLAELIAAKAAIFHEVAAEGVVPYPGVVELVKSLAGKLPLAICSGALRSDIEPVLVMLGIGDAFDCMVTAEDVAASKPDPASYRLAVQCLQKSFPEAAITAAETVAIEDTPAGIASARGAGMKVLAVSNSYPAEELAAADRIVAALSEIDVEELQQLVL
jgi:HAD superfamily hydrolase (TIGR01509 family)